MYKTISILDIDCGEGLHGIKTIENMDCTYYGMDYTKDAINMATDYLSDNSYYFVADVNNLPFIDHSFEVILDILSPFNEIEVKRLLKKDGLFIKVVPGNNYLKELRKVLNIKDYISDQNKLLNKFETIESYNINKTISLKEDDSKYLIGMTPVKETYKKEDIILSEITINLIVYISKDK